MKLFYLKTFLPCLLLAIGSKVFAHDIEVKNTDGITIYYNLINNDTELEVTFEGTYFWNSFVYSGGIIIPESVTIEGTTYNVTSIGSHAFDGRTGINDVTIPNSVTKIGEYAFKGCSSLSSVSFPECLEFIGRYAFIGTSIKSFNLPDNIISFGIYPISDTFGDEAKLYVKRGTKTLLSLWQNYGKPYKKETEEILPAPYLQSTDSTQTSLHIKINNYYDEFKYEIDNNEIVKESDIFYSNLFPGNQSFYLKVKLNDHSYVRSNTLHTQPLNEKIDYTKTASSIRLKASYTKGDANITGIRLKAFNSDFNAEVADSALVVTGLAPLTWIRMYMEIDITNANGIKRTYEVGSKWNYGTGITTNLDNLTLTTLQPKVVSPGNVVVAAESNLDDAEEKVGFEWRRTDWTDDFQSNTCGAYLYEGTMEGYIRNLNTEKLWKYRAYYESNSGNRYYSDWVGLDPTNTSYFEPTVHTYTAVSVEGNKAMVKGYVMRGSDNVTAQGFKYWKMTAGARADVGSNVTVPSTVLTVTASGNIMEAELSGLDFETDYGYVTFATTSEGEIFYGEQRAFTTGVDPTGIESINNTSGVTETARYDLRGRKMDVPQAGLNIIRMSDGTIRKVMVK